MKKIFYISALSLAFLASASFALDLTTYTTKFGSTIEIEVGQNNTITGFYTPGDIVADKICKGSSLGRTPLVGEIADNTVVFSAVFAECGKTITLGGKLEGSEFRTTSVKITRTSLAADESLIGGRP